MSQYLVVNFDRQEYLRPAAFGEEPTLKGIVFSYEGVLTALAVLLADGNNRGGGDLRSDADVIGTWAGNRIAIVDDKAVDAELSLPGLEDIPLQQQMLNGGKDVSKEVFAAIKAAEGGYWACSALTDQLKLSPVMQRTLPSSALAKIATAEGRLQPLEATEDFFGVLGQGAPITPLAAKRSLQKGLDRMGPAFGMPQRWQIDEVRMEAGMKPMNTSMWSSEKTLSMGTVALHVTATNLDDGAPLSVTFALGPKGVTTRELYSTFFPGIEFESAPSITSNVRSPEVARLLANIKLSDTSLED